MKATISSLILIASAQVSTNILPDVAATVSVRLIGTGTQNYKCTNGTFKFIRPVAKLSGEGVTGDHFFQDTAKANGGIATWQTTSGTFIGTVIGKVDDADKVNNIASLLLENTDGNNVGKVGAADFVQRLESKGGQPPSSCDVEGQALEVPYQSVYVFLRKDAEADQVESSTATESVPKLEWSISWVQVTTRINHYQTLLVLPRIKCHQK